MNSKFQSVVQQKDDVSLVKISGVIDEDNELAPLADKLTTGTAIIDLSEIDRINSCGVRDWVNWLGRVEKGGVKKIVLANCSPSIVAQINLVSNFTGSGVVRSFYAPYFCPNCDREKVMLVEARDLAGRQPFKAPTCRCDECDGVMDFDDMEESFFAFLSNAKKVDTDDAVDAAMNELTPATGSDRKLRLRTSISNPGLTPGAAAGGVPSAGSGTHSGRVTGSFSVPTRTGTGTQQPMMGTGTGQKWPPAPSTADELSRRFTLAPPPPEPKSAGAWILVGVLVAAAIALLAYVFLSGPSKPTHTRVFDTSTDVARQ